MEVKDCVCMTAQNFVEEFNIPVTTDDWNNIDVTVDEPIDVKEGNIYEQDNFETWINKMNEPGHTEMKKKCFVSQPLVLKKGKHFREQYDQIHPCQKEYDTYVTRKVFDNNQMDTQCNVVLPNNVLVIHPGAAVSLCITGDIYTVTFVQRQSDDTCKLQRLNMKNNAGLVMGYFIMVVQENIHNSLCGFHD